VLRGGRPVHLLYSSTTGGEANANPSSRKMNSGAPVRIPVFDSAQPWPGLDRTKYYVGLQVVACTVPPLRILCPTRILALTRISAVTIHREILQ